jgi:F0F1-type ATP synthase assembly protein I
MPTNPPAPVELDELLAAEFDYIAQTAIQANEDRARVSSFYLIAVGSLVAAMFGTQLFDPNFFTQTVSLMFSGLFVLLTLLGTSTVMQLARLRGAWYESVLAMNQLKEYMMNENESLVRAFRWTAHTLPAKYKRGSVSYYQALEVALISGLMFGAAAFFAQQAFFSTGWLHWIIAALLGFLMVYIQLAFYKRVIIQ